MKIHNFSAGPSILPKEVMQKASQAVKELDDSGLSLIEISHRSKNFVDIMDEACEKALNITKLKGKGYKALFLQGGASLQSFGKKSWIYKFWHLVNKSNQRSKIIRRSD